MKIEVYHRKEGPPGIYITGDLSKGVPPTVRVVRDGKSTDVELAEWHRKALEDQIFEPVLYHLGHLE